MNTNKLASYVRDTGINPRRLQAIVNMIRELQRKLVNTLGQAEDWPRHARNFFGAFKRNRSNTTALPSSGSNSPDVPLDGSGKSVIDIRDRSSLCLIAPSII